MSFDLEVAKDGRGRVIRIDGSEDDFATVSYRWSDKAGTLDGTNQYDNRLISLAPIRRGLGQNRIATGATTSLELDNADGALDALCGYSSIDLQAKIRFRIYVALYDPDAPTAFFPKLLGEFILTEWGEQDDSRVTLQLGDDVLGPIGQQAALPTIEDWQAVGNTTNNPIFTNVGLPSNISEKTPIQLAFGEDWVLALPHLIPWESPNSNYYERVIVPICVTTDLGPASQSMISNLRCRWIAFDDDGGPGGNGNGEIGVRLRDIPRTVIRGGTGGLVVDTVWTVEKSPTITKDGKSFKVVYLVVMTSLGIQIYNDAVAGNWDTTSLGQYGQTGGYPVTAVEWMGPNYRVTASRVLAWYVKGVPLSAITQQTSPVQHAVDVLTDLATKYSNNTAIAVDATGAARVKQGNSSAACAGVIQPWSTGPKKGEVVIRTDPPSLRQAISRICQSSDLDVFINWSGNFSFASDVADYTTATQAAGLISIPETALESGVKRRIPGDGERWAPFNRVSLNGGRPNEAEDLPVPFQGPWDLDGGAPGAPDEAAIALSSRIIEVTLEQGWRPFRQQSLDPRAWRSINVKARDTIRFRTNIEALRLELGQYFKLSWTRGELGGPYLNAIFQLEEITYAPDDDTVEISAIWRDDTVSELPYLLDDETLLVRSKNSGTSAFQVLDGSGACNAFGGSDNFTTMGVQAGDIVVLRDSTQAADIFTRNRCLRIASVFDSDTVIVTGDLDFGFPGSGTIAAADWYIVRGATTYPVTFFTNYPDGGAMYGKATDSAGIYSDSTTGNRLLSG
jgi:hypothetical protein